MSITRIARTWMSIPLAVGLLFIAACDAQNGKPSASKTMESVETADKMGRVETATEKSAKVDAQFTPQPEPTAAPQAEDYALIVENPFKRAAFEPISTFSADVNTASYANVRRFIESGSLPPVDAVRTAELVNYFDYDYPKPKGQDPVAIGLELGPCPWQRDHKLLRIALKAKTIEDGELPPRNLVFLVDVSGSMNSANKLPLVQRSLEMLVEQLGRQDRVSLVTYAGSTQVVLPSTPGDQKPRISNAIRSLRSGGGTAGAQGLQLAYDQAMTDFNPAAVNRVLICTDGDFNIGPHSDSEMVHLIEEKRKSGVYLSVLGFGMGNLKDAKLEQIARHGNGHYAYIDNDLEARKVFIEQGAALIPAAKDVKLQVDFNAAKVQAYRLIGYENRMMEAKDFRDDTKDAGDMGMGHAVTALYQIVPVGVTFDSPDIEPMKYQKAEPTEAAQSGEWLTVRMRYKNPEGGAAQEFAEVLGENAFTAKPSVDSRFAAAVAEFGLLLRDSPYKGNADFGNVSSTAASAIGSDPNGHRGEFVHLVNQAAELK